MVHVVKQIVTVVKLDNQMYKNRVNGLPLIVVQEFNKVWMLSSKAAQERRKKAP